MITFIFTHSGPFPTYFGSKRSPIMVSFNFLNVFSISFEFSITRRIGTEWNYNFYFLSFLSIPNLFWLKINPKWYFLIFLIFLLFFLKFSATCLVGTKRNDDFYFLSFSSFTVLFWLQMKP